MTHEIIIESPLGPIHTVVEANGENVVPGTGGWGIDPEGKAFHDPAGVPGSEVAYFSLDPNTGAPVLIRQ